MTDWTRIGGSDVAVLAGASPFSTLAHLQQRMKSGKATDINSQRAEWGNWLELPVATRWAQQRGLGLFKPPSETRPDRPFERVSMDFIWQRSPFELTGGGNAPRNIPDRSLPSVLNRAPMRNDSVGRLSRAILLRRFPKSAY
jgi:hypothetical protein